MPALLIVRRPLARGTLLGAGVLLVGTLVALPTWHRVARPGAAPLPASEEGWTLRGVRQARWQGAGAGLVLSADEVHVERTRLGPFRVGFARTVTARNLRIEGDDAPAAGSGPAGAPRRSGGGRPGAAVTAVRVDGLHLRLGRGAERVELDAGRCVVSLLGAGRVRCDRTVRVRGPGVAHTVATLAWDPASRRLVAGGATDTPALRALNGLFARLAPSGFDALRAGLAPLS